MRIIDGWRTVLVRSWANRLNMINAGLLIAPVILPFFGMLPEETRQVLPTWFFRELPIALIMLSIIARVVEQPKLQKKLNKRKMEKVTAASAEARRKRRLAAAQKLLAEEKLLIEKMNENTGGY